MRKISGTVFTRRDLRGQARVPKNRNTKKERGINLNEETENTKTPIMLQQKQLLEEACQKAVKAGKWHRNFTGIERHGPTILVCLGCVALLENLSIPVDIILGIVALLQVIRVISDNLVGPNLKKQFNKVVEEKRGLSNIMYDDALLRNPTDQSDVELSRRIDSWIDGDCAKKHPILEYSSEDVSLRQWRRNQ